MSWKPDTGSSESPARRSWRLAFGAAIAVLVMSAAAAQERSGEPRVLGHERTLPVFHLEPGDDGAASAPVIDGVVNEDEWRAASASTGFWNSLQDRPPTDQTEVFAMTDGRYLYFGFRMYDAMPSAIQATRTVRDGGVGYDDLITVQLDTFFNRRDISKFSLNPLGTQSDDIAGGRSTKIEWKGDWQGAAATTEFGWSAEFAIPYAILNYEEGSSIFGVNFKRYQSRTKETSYWADITPQGLEEEMGQLNGLAVPPADRQDAWTFMPFALAGRHIADEHGDIEDSLITAGLDIRYEPRADLTAAFAINPDFSQVEEAITNISFSYSEKSLDENRPFFAEGADYFSPDKDGNEYFYSNRVPDFDIGAKSFGRVGRARYGLLTTVAPDNRTDFVGRTLYEVNETNSAMATVVSTNRAEFDSLLTVAQFRGRQPSGLRYSIDAAISSTDNVAVGEVPEGDGNHYAGTIGWQSDYVYTRVNFDRYETAYFPANALLDSDLPGTEGRSVIAGYYRELTHPLLRVVEGYAGVKRRDTLLGPEQQLKRYAGGSTEFNNEIRVSVYHEDGPYRPRGDARGVFKEEFNDDRYSSVAVDFNTRSNRYSGGVRYDSGNLGGGPYSYTSAYGWWRPLNTLYLRASAEQIESFGTYNQFVLSTSWDIDSEQSLSARLIRGEEDNYYRIAYSHRPRQGLDIFAIYDTNSLERSKVSFKVVATF